MGGTRSWRTAWGSRATAVALVCAALVGVLLPPSSARAGVPHVFVFSGTYGFRHSSITHAKDVIAQLATSTGAFTVEFSEDPAAFTSELYGRTDIVYFLSATGEYPLSATQKRALMRFFACGGGYVSTHAASDANYSWPDMLELVGAWFNTHPNGWGNPPVTLVVEDQANPATAPWHGQTSFQHADEYYKWRLDPRGTQDVQPLFSLDESTTTSPSAYHDNQPVAWSKTFRGLGRVIHSNIGHGDAVFDFQYWKDHIVGAIQWVAAPGVNRQCVSAPAGAVVERSSAKVASLAAAAGGSGFGGAPVDYALADTAAALSKRLFTTSDTVVVAGAGDYAAGLVAAPLAAHLDAPLLFTSGTALSPETEAEIARLKATEAIVVGDTAAVGGAVSDDLANGADDRPGLPVPAEPRSVACDAGVPSCTGVPLLNDDLTVRRIAGDDIYQTAALVAAEFPASAPAYLVNGEDDGAAGRQGLAAAGAAARRGAPILLTPSAALPASTEEAIAGRDVTLVGGPSSLSAAVEQAAARAAATSRRLDGGSRAATSLLVADTAALSAGSVWLASGADLPQHAVLAGAAAGLTDGVLVLVGPGEVAPSTREWLRRAAAEATNAGVVGPVEEVGHAAVACAQQILLTAAGATAGCGA